MGAEKRLVMVDSALEKGGARQSRSYLSLNVGSLRDEMQRYTPGLWAIARACASRWSRWVWGERGKGEATLLRAPRGVK